MIQPSELRIDNWVMDYYGIKRRVAYVGETIGLHNDAGGTDRYQNNPIWSNALKDLHPIPLTPAILEKCGFEREDKNGNTENYSVFTKDFFTFNTIHGWWLYGRNWHFGEKLKSLHQLQNLYYALCGEELKITSL